MSGFRWRISQGLAGRADGGKLRYLGYCVGCVALAGVLWCDCQERAFGKAREGWQTLFEFNVVRGTDGWHRVACCLSAWWRAGRWRVASRRQVQVAGCVRGGVGRARNGFHPGCCLVGCISAGRQALMSDLVSATHCFEHRKLMIDCD